ncbi:hypothetical protein HY025_02745 [Candidatus Daviesbacteria bacterium]|nr:hypothetical protein [Candidatus Daviesbacteria bacterium]
MEREAIVINSSFRTNFKPQIGQLSEWSNYQTRWRETKEAPVRIIGFNTREETKALFRNINTSLVEGQSYVQAVSDAATGLKENLQSWYEEYPVDNPFIKVRYFIKEINGQDRWVDSAGYPIVDGILEQERGGAALNFAQKTETLLTKKDTSQDKLAIGISPRDQNGTSSGLFDQSGNQIAFPDSYIYVYRKINGQLRSLVLRTNLSVDECLSLRESLGKCFTVQTDQADNLSIQEKIIDLVENGIYVEENQSQDPFKQVLEEVLRVNPQAFGERFVKLEEVFQALEDYDSSIEYDQKVLDTVARVKEILLVNQNLDENFDKVDQVLTDSLLRLTLYGKGIKTISETLSYQDIQKALGIMQTSFHGCAGSGSGTNISFLPGLAGLRIGLSSDETWTQGECQSCHQNTEVSCNLCKSCVEKIKQAEKLGIKHPE